MYQFGSVVESCGGAAGFWTNFSYWTDEGDVYDEDCGEEFGGYEIAYYADV